MLFRGDRLRFGGLASLGQVGAASEQAVTWRQRTVSSRCLLSPFNSTRPRTLYPLARPLAARYIQNMTPHTGYPSDLSDDRWQLIEPVLSAWRAERRGRGLDMGRPPEHDCGRS